MNKKTVFERNYEGRSFRVNWLQDKQEFLVEELNEDNDTWGDPELNSVGSEVLALYAVKLFHLVGLLRELFKELEIDIDEEGKLNY